MKKLILLPILLLPLFSGCSTTNAAKIITAAGKDPASVHMRITTIYGVIEYDRTNPTTNSSPHSVSDGSISVK